MSDVPLAILTKDGPVSNLIERYRKFWWGLCLLALFSLITVALFWRILFSSGIYFPLGGDFASKDFPQNVFAARALQRGEIPLWNPYAMTGYPFAADPNVGLFYPLKLLFMLAIPGFTYLEMEYLLVVHYFLSGLFTYLLARDLGTSRTGGIVAGLVFMLSGFMIGQLEHPNIVMTATWFPLIFLFFRRAILRGRVPDAIGSGILLAISLLGGQQQFSILAVSWMLLWLIGYWVMVKRSGAWREVRSAVLVFAIAFAGAAVQILPSVELISQSLRGQLEMAEATAMNLPPIGWFALILPHFFGPNGLQAQSVWSGYGNWNEAYGYVGVVTLFLAALGLALRARDPESLSRYEACFLAVTALLGLLLAAGNSTPLYNLAYTTIPVLRFLRVPARFIYWFDTSLPLLAGFGIEFFAGTLAARARWHRAIFLSVGIVLAAAGFVRVAIPMTAERISDLNLFLLLIGGLFSTLVFQIRLRHSRNLLVALVVALLALDLFAAQGTYNLTTHDPLTDFRIPEGLDRQRVGNVYRIDAMPEALAAWQPLTGVIDSVPTAFGLPWNPFTLTLFQDYWAVADLINPAYDFLAVRYLIAPRGMTLPANWMVQPSADPDLQVYENTQAWPRAFVVFQSIIEPDRERALDLVQRGAFDPRTTVLLDAGVPISRSGASGNVRIVTSKNNSLVLEATLAESGYLVLSDAYYPGWRVWVDEREQQVLRANYAFRAVPLETGQHSVRFEFDPLSWRIGLAVSAIAWCVLGIAGVVYAASRIRRERLVSPPQNGAAAG